MTPQERYQKVKQIVYQAMELNAATRQEFIVEACGKDASLIQEVKDLLNEEDSEIEFSSLLRNKIADESHSVIKAIFPNGDLIGQKLKERYYIEAKHQEDSLSTTYLAKDLLASNQKRLVKVLKPQLSQNLHQWLENHFNKEIQIIQSISHPAIVALLDFGFTNVGQPFLVMEFVQVMYSLRSEIIVGKGLKDGFTHVASVIEQLGDAINAVHQQGIYHRDLKPENIIIELDPITKQERVRIIGFGITTINNFYDEQIKTTVLVNSSHHYLSPEGFVQKPTKSTDIYALGIIAYEMVTGNLPFQQNLSNNKNSWSQINQHFEKKINPIKPSTYNPQLSAQAEEIILSALAYNPKDRYESASKFGTDLAKVLLASPKIDSITNKIIKHISIPISKQPVKNISILAITLIMSILVAELIFRVSWPHFNPVATPSHNIIKSVATKASILELSYSLTLQEVIKNNTYSTPIPLAGQEVIFHNGDLIKLHLTSSSDGYLYILNESPELVNGLPKYTLLFPGQTETHYFKAGKSIVVPVSEEPGFLFTSPTGTEKIWFVYSKRKIQELETIKYLLNEKDLGIVRNIEQITQIQTLLSKQHPQQPQLDEENNQIKVKSKSDTLITSVKLTHFR